MCFVLPWYIGFFAIAIVPWLSSLMVVAVLGVALISDSNLLSQTTSCAADGSLIGFSDADWAGDMDNRHSTIGNLFIMSGGAISWLSRKQPVVTLSIN